MPLRFSSCADLNCCNLHANQSNSKISNHHLSECLFISGNIIYLQLKSQFMRKIKLLSICLVLAVSASAQLKNQTQPPEIWSQCLNTLNVYGNIITISNMNNGTFLDTLTNTGVIILEFPAIKFKGSGQSGAPVTNADTVTHGILSDYGYISFFARTYKCTGTATVNVVPVESLDGIAWHAITNCTQISLNPTSLTVPIDADFTNILGLPIPKTARHYGLMFTGVGTQTSSIQAWIHYYLFKP